MDYKELLKQIQNKLDEILKTINVDNIKQELAEITKKESNQDFYLDIEKAVKLAAQKKSAQELLDTIDLLVKNINDIKFCVESFSETELAELNVIESLQEIKKKIDQLHLETLYKGKWDNCNCVLEIHSGAGGEEAQDWAEMLERMYIRYGEIMGYKVKEVDKLYGTGAGVKSVSISFSGKHAYGNLINEKGVHRLVRISPFDANSRRHTSFASVDVTPIIEEKIDIQILPEDIKIDTYRSGGAGGQHVNKTESAVRITHLKTGIVVQCQNERSQLQNKEFALKMLKSKLIELEENKREQEKMSQKSSDKKIEWGSQIRSYVLHPYNMVKDHRTGYETSNTTAVLDGEIADFISAMLVFKNKND